MKRINYKIVALIVVSALTKLIDVNASSIDKNWSKDLLDNTPELKYENATYWSSIHTVTSHITGSELTQPILGLNSQETITFGFDELSGSVSDFYYSIIHCDANWQNSNLMEQEYLTGFFTYNVTSYNFSFNTFQNYIHYELQLPNEKTQITKSGNYLLVVYANNDPENIVLSRRFMVYENKAGVFAQYKRASDPEHMFYKQEIDFTLNIGGLQVNNPYSDIEVVILQNFRWDNAIRNVKPRFIKENELVYDLDDPNIFNGGNEFRFLDLKSIAYRTPNVDYISKEETPYSIHLLKEEIRPYKKYITNYDINGAFVIRNEDATEHNTESDYYYVHFYLPYPSIQDTGAFYLFGAFTDWQIKPEYKMSYNERNGLYECTTLLKGGYYNYEYVYKADKKSELDETIIEGNHYETENQYVILIYHKDLRLNYHRLIGVRQINSVKG